MQLTRRQSFLLLWFVAMSLSGFFVWQASGVSEYGFATSLGILAISLGVPLMRAFTEFSE